MSLAALLSGMALANARLGAIHGLAGPIGGRFPAPHGAVCASLLPAAMRTNLNALRARAQESETLKRFDELGWLLVGDPRATADSAVAWLTRLCLDLRVPGMRAFGITPSDFPDLIAAGRVSSSMRGNPLVLTDQELGSLLQEAL
jgi:alcohol dehydrogenase class IV